MDGIMTSLQSGLDTLIAFLPMLLAGILLILVTWIIAALIKRAVTKGFKAAGVDNLFYKWGVAQDKEGANASIDALGKVAYYLVWVLFLPTIFQALGLSSIGEPIQNMIDTALAYIPNLIGAIVIIVLGVIASRFIKNLVYNVAVATNIDSYLDKLMGTSEVSEDVQESKDTLAKALGNIVYFLVLIPILVVALETLQIASITEPVVNVLNTILNAIPNILVAIVLLAVGFLIAKVVGDVLQQLLEGSGLNKYSKTLREKANVNLNLAKVTGQTVAVVIGLLFFVEALNALQLDILNTVGSAIIAYIPNVLAAIILIGLAFVGGQYLADAIKKSTGSKLAGLLLKYSLIIFGVFMALDQLNFASGIVQPAFFLIIGALALAFAIAFGLGGRDFARNQLNKADNRLEEESRKSDETNNSSNV